MARNSSGTYSVAKTLLPGTTARASDVNDIAKDLGDAVTDSLSRSGSGGMLAPLRAIDGNPTGPGISFTADPDTGFRRSADGTIAVVSNGADVASFGPTGITSGVKGAAGVGSGSLWFTNTPPAGWLICNGQHASRTEYAALFAVIGTTYGAGNGTTTFALPDLRGCAPVGSDLTPGNGNSGRLTNFFGAAAHTLGAIFGSAVHVLSLGQMPAHQHGGSTDAQGNHAHNVTMRASGSTSAGNAFILGPQMGSMGYTTDVQGNHAHNFATDWRGNNEAHNNVQPSFVLNFIIYTGK